MLTCGLNLEFSISATSRQPRHTEINGKDYYFISNEEFHKKVKNNEFLEWEEVYKGTAYGTLLNEVERIRNKGNHVVFDVDVVGGLNIKKYYGEKALAVFVQPPSVEELRNRLTGRSTETEEKVKMRIEKAEHELSFANQFDVILINDNLQIAFIEAEKIISEFINS